MLAAGRVKVTVTSKSTGEHITILFKAFKDNRDRTFRPNGKNWEPCEYAQASHVFVEVPNQGDWNDKVGTFYPGGGRWYSDRNVDPAREAAAAAAARWISGDLDAPTDHADFAEQSECGRCGKELTDPESIARGIGPTCLGLMTGSQHQVKQSNPRTEEEAEEATQQEIKRLGSLDAVAGVPTIELGDLEQMSDAGLESVIAEAQRLLHKRAFARQEREQEHAAYTSKMERDNSFLGR